MSTESKPTYGLDRFVVDLGVGMLVGMLMVLAYGLWVWIT